MSVEQGAYQGCCVNPNWFFNPGFTPPPVNYFKLPEMFKFDLLAGFKLTDQEQEILKKLVEAYSLFTNLENRSDADNKEFVDAVHRAQQLIALRVARRVNPEVWHQP
jgi:hypothetical protein